MTVIALHREQKNPQKSKKKLRKFPKKLALPGFDRYKIPQKSTKIEPDYIKFPVSTRLGEDYTDFRDLAAHVIPSSPPQAAPEL